MDTRQINPIDNLTQTAYDIVKFFRTSDLATSKKILREAKNNYEYYKISLTSFLYQRSDELEQLLNRLTQENTVDELIAFFSKGQWYERSLNPVMLRTLIKNLTGYNENESEKLSADELKRTSELLPAAIIRCINDEVNEQEGELENIRLAMTKLTDEAIKLEEHKSRLFLEKQELNHCRLSLRNEELNFFGIEIDENIEQFDSEAKVLELQQLMKLNVERLNISLAEIEQKEETLKECEKQVLEKEKISLLHLCSLEKQKKEYESHILNLAAEMVSVGIKYDLKSESWWSLVTQRIEIKANAKEEKIILSTPVVKKNDEDFFSAIKKSREDYKHQEESRIREKMVTILAEMDASYLPSKNNSTLFSEKPSSPRNVVSQEKKKEEKNTECRL